MPPKRRRVHFWDGGLPGVEQSALHEDAAKLTLEDLDKSERLVGAWKSTLA